MKKALLTDVKQNRSRHVVSDARGLRCDDPDSRETEDYAEGADEVDVGARVALEVEERDCVESAVEMVGEEAH